jgi:hypothetical protein
MTADVDCMACVASLAFGGHGEGRDAVIEGNATIEGVTHAVVNFGARGRGWIACTVEWDAAMGYYTMYSSKAVP